MGKIKVETPIVELLGDEMAAVLWEKVKGKLLLPFLELSLKTYDLSIQHRDSTNDAITTEAAAAIKEYGVGVKCATITPDADRVKEFDLKKMYKSPNGTIRNTLGGTVFREPILCKNIPPFVNSWKEPIIIGRHACFDQYQATEVRIKEKGTLTLSFKEDNGTGVDTKVFHFDEPGVAMAMFNLDSSITHFAKACMTYALERKFPLFLSTKNTVLKTYDGKFKELFDEIFEKEFKDKFYEANITYEHRLIDDMVAYSLKSKGGFLWACKNYDGDVQSDAIAGGFGSLGMMSSILLSPDGKTVEAEAAHGTVTRHFRRHQKGETTSTNPVATIFAWTKALHYRATFDANEPLLDFAQNLEKSCIETIESGKMTRDLAILCQSSNYLSSDAFIDAVAECLRSL